MHLDAVVLLLTLNFASEPVMDSNIDPLSLILALQNDMARAISPYICRKIECLYWLLIVTE